MTDIHAALGLSQLKRLSGYVEKRHQIAANYDKEFENMNVQRPYRNPANRSALHLYVVQVCPLQHKRVFHTLRNKTLV